MMRSALLATALLLFTGCARHAPDNGADANLSNAIASTPTPTPTPSPTTSATPVVTAGFDPASAPVSDKTLGAFPFFGLLDGYTPYKSVSDSWTKDQQKDAQYDHYEVFDGTRLITVEGRLRTIEAVGKGASFFQVQKTYEKLVHDAGGVTVWEGSGQVLKDKHIDYQERRQRDRYGSGGAEKMGVYMIRLPDRQIWVEVYNSNDEDKDNYWLTVVETKPLEVKVQLIPAEQMKQTLDSTGHVALYINFDTDKATIRPDSQPIVAQVVKLLTDYPQLKLEVQGHTDNSGAADHNQTLSAARANAVVGALMAQGIAMNRLTPKGYGQTKPLADNATEDGKAKNRRVELVKK